MPFISSTHYDPAQFALGGRCRIWIRLGLFSESATLPFGLENVETPATW